MQKKYDYYTGLQTSNYKMYSAEKVARNSNLFINFNVEYKNNS